MSDYQSIVRNNIDKVYQTGIATKILQHMSRIRNSSSLTQARRWVMELLQNSQDAAYEERKVKVEIRLTDNDLEYRHNGRPFRVKDILSIVNQVSSKADDEETVGKFGTGFVTTFQLSEVVQLTSVVQDKVHKEDGTEVMLPCKPFSITLDRRGITDEEIMKCIAANMQELERLDASDELIDMNPDDYHTCFHYFLNSRNSKEAARIGLEDLEDTIYYILCFSPKLEQVEIIYDTSDKKGKVVYKVSKEAKRGLFSVKEIQVSRSCNLDSKLHRVLYLENDGVTLAGILRDNDFEPISEKTPRLFINFPLLGAENFPFPIVVNGNFASNEPRSGISLSDNVNSVDAIKNKEMITKAVQLYSVYIREALAHEYGSMENILSIPKWQDNPEMSAGWVEEHIYHGIFSFLQDLKLFPTATGNAALTDSDFYLVDGENDNEMEQVKELVSLLKGRRVPEDRLHWVACLQGYKLPGEKILTLSKLVEGCAEYKNHEVDTAKCEPMEWHKRLWKAAMQNESISQRVRADEVAIFPNQANEDKERLFTISQVYRDPGIPEILKDVSDRLDTLKGSSLLDTKLCIRNSLIHPDFLTGDCKEIRDYEVDKLFTYIITKSDRNYKVVNYNLMSSVYNKAWRDAWFFMLSCGYDRSFYDIVKVIFPGEVSEYLALQDAPYSNYENRRLWNNSYANLISMVSEEIRAKSEGDFFEAATLSEFAKNCFEGREEKAISWLNEFYEKAFEYRYPSDVMEKRIFPLQNGEIERAYGHFLDGTKDDELKEIAYAFSDREPELNYTRQLFDRRLKLPEGQNFAVKRQEEIAGMIDRTVNQILSVQKLKDESIIHQEAGTKLLAWIRKHKAEGLSQKLFPSFCNDDDQMRLLTPEAAMAMSQRAEATEEIMKLLNCNSTEDIVSALSSMKENLERLESQNEARTGKGTELLFMEESDVFFDTDLQDSFESQDEFEEYCRYVGTFGEKFAFEKIGESLEEQGFVETERSVLLGKRGERIFEKINDGSVLTAKLEYPDFYDHFIKQPGYDLKLTVTGENEEDARVRYFEVKTHTNTSKMKKEVVLSDQQMNYALKYGDNFSLVNVLYNRSNEQESVIEILDNICLQIRTGRLANTSKGYRFKLNLDL